MNANSEIIEMILMCVACLYNGDFCVIFIFLYQFDNNGDPFVTLFAFLAVRNLTDLGKIGTLAYYTCNVQMNI